MAGFVLAEPGWRVVIADRESGGALYAPIVAWAYAYSRAGVALPATPDEGVLEPFIVEPYAGASVRALSVTPYAGYALGILAPDDKAELGAWDEQAAERLEGET